MKENNWNPEQPQEPWEKSSYQTGSTQPPKKRSGLLAVLLVAVIFLSGISSALGLLNIKLSNALMERDDREGPVIFYPTDSETAGNVSAGEKPPTASLPANSGELGLELNQAPDAVQNVPQEGGLSLQEIYKKSIHSVVSIRCTQSDGISSGTGVVLSQNGYLITNAHVVEDATAIEIRFTDERVMGAALVGADPVSDLAVLYVDAKDLTPAVFGDSSGLQVGDAVVAIGDPLGEEFRGTMTDGIVSAINREVSLGGRTMTLIQTNAALNSGNSGGPLLNCYGQVIGINTMKISAFTDKAGVEGLGFAIPSTTVKDIVDQLLTKGYVAGRPSLGIQGEAVSAAYQRYYRLPAGVRITQVLSGGAAKEAGLEVGDILLSINGVRVTDSDALATALYSYKAGDTVQLSFYRGHLQRTVSVTLGQAGA